MTEKENFDEELKNRIKQVFEEYDDGTADAGWNLLREKFPKKNRRDYLFWCLASVAALFLIGFIFWILKPNFHQDKFSKHIKDQQVDSTLTNKIYVKRSNQNYTLFNQTDNKKTSIKTASSLPEQHLSNQNKTTDKHLLGDTINTNKTSVKTASDFTAKHLSNQNKIADKHLLEDTINTNKTSIKTASGFTTKYLSNQNKIADKHLVGDTINTNKTSVKTASDFAAKYLSNQNKQNEKSIDKQNSNAKLVRTKQKNTAFTDIKTARENPIKQHQNLFGTINDSTAKSPIVVKKIDLLTTKIVVKPVGKLEKTKKLADKYSIFSLSLYAGPFLNYANGSNNQLGFGAGISTDFNLAKNFKLSTGLGLLQNNLTYRNNISNISFAIASSTYSSAVSVPTLFGQSSTLKSFDASLLALDIPINFVYLFSPGKNSIAVSAGLSSGTFIQESYHYHYTTSSIEVQNSKSFSNFNFVKTLNLSAGFAYPLGKNKLQVEPFVKYPLGGTGSQQLKFGSVGINLKINFKSLKK